MFAKVGHWRDDSVTKNMNSVASINFEWPTTVCNSRSRESDTFFWTPLDLANTCTKVHIPPHIQTPPFPTTTLLKLRRINIKTHTLAHTKTGKITSKVLAAQADDMNLILAFTWWKERTDNQMLSLFPRVHCGTCMIHTQHQ